MENNIAFRRVRGRIVPIKLNKIKKNNAQEIAKGVGIAGAGASVSAASGYAYKKINQTATRMAFRGFNAADRVVNRAYGPKQTTMTSFFRKKKAVDLAAKLSKKAARIGSFAPGVRRAGLFGGSLLIGLGAAKISAAVTKEKNENLNRTIGAAAAAIAFKSKGASTLLFKGGAYPKAAAIDTWRRVAPIIKKHLKKMD